MGPKADAERRVEIPSARHFGALGSGYAGGRIQCASTAVV